jgi:hypothetical protein
VTDELNQKLAEAQDEVQALQEQVVSVQNRGDHRSEASPGARLHVVFGQNPSDNAAAEAVQRLDEWEGRHRTSSNSSSELSLNASMFATQHV